MTSTNTIILDMPLVRQYLRSAAPTNGHDIVEDAFGGFEEGARELLKLCLPLRGNPRTRQTMSSVSREWRRTRRGRTEPVRWYNRLCEALMGMFRVFRTYAFPMLQRLSEPALQDTLSRRVRRLIGYSGAVQVAIPSLRQRAEEVKQALWQDLVGRDVVMWLDNWYLQRYTTNPDKPVLSQDVTAMAVLLLTAGPGGAPATRTRSRTIQPFPGHRSLHQMALHVNSSWEGTSSILFPVSD